MTLAEKLAKETGQTVEFVRKAMEIEASDHPIIAKNYPMLIALLVKDELRLDPEAYEEDMEGQEDDSQGQEMEGLEKPSLDRPLVQPENPNPLTAVVDEALERSAGTPPLGMS
jgi:hypothetical protein